MSRLYRVTTTVFRVLRPQLRIAVVGANDGRHSDPIYQFALKHRKSTSLLLIEPNSAVIPFLKSNYAKHPHHRIANCAVGTEGALILYSIRPELWNQFQPPYAKDWPEYRAATGITSASRDHVVNHLRRDSSLDPDAAIIQVTVPSKSLASIVQEAAWEPALDILQIDAEGHDHLVLQSANLDTLRPTLVLFESIHLPASGREELRLQLLGQGYRCFSDGNNTLAVSVQQGIISRILVGTAIIVSWLLSHRQRINKVDQ